MNAADEAWQRYVAASMVQMNVVAAINEVPDLATIERGMDDPDTPVT